MKSFNMSGFPSLLFREVFLFIFIGTFVPQIDTDLLLQKKFFFVNKLSEFRAVFKGNLCETWIADK
jgi:hypothetical protein